MKNSAAILKELKKIGGALNEVVAPQIVVCVIDEDPETVLDRMVAAGETAASQRDDALIIRRLIVDPKPLSTNKLSAAEEDNTKENQSVNL